MYCGPCLHTQSTSDSLQFGGSGSGMLGSATTITFNVNRRVSEMHFVGHVHSWSIQGIGVSVDALV
ncbi:hypothetical protein MJO28_014336 [Puccinia striiformis f. sp. tritici]|uniref:Uncharacterized protein n=1 Tax=Puccinia striiformis f. sp. tritici TaxID=168172 RepID=A0ACC0DTG7_9BASI|nr:hypothetical protein MJO28_014336 [Puccinia striiformis f. sp. tritici]